MSSIQDLPIELVQYIGSFLNHSELYLLSQSLNYPEDLPARCHPRRAIFIHLTSLFMDQMRDLFHFIAPHAKDLNLFSEDESVADMFFALLKKFPRLKKLRLEGAFTNILELISKLPQLKNLTICDIDNEWIIEDILR